MYNILTFSRLKNNIFRMRPHLNWSSIQIGLFARFSSIQRIPGCVCVCVYRSYAVNVQWICVIRVFNKLFVNFFLFVRSFGCSRDGASIANIYLIST